jgi:glycosyltransferase involved in cell wall biosynthesis
VSSIRQKILVVIPVRNVEEMIEETLEQINESNLRNKSKIIIIDNRSTDTTLARIDSYLQKKFPQIDCEVIANEQNIGYGGSVKKGIKLSINQNYEWTVIVHGDNQTNWQLVLNEFDKLIESNHYEIICTTRFDKESNISKYSKLRTAGNRFFKVLTIVCTNLKISDPGVAIMAFKTKIVESFNLDLINEGYMFHPQLNLLIFSGENRYIEIPMLWQDATRREPLNLFAYGIGLEKFLLKYGYYFKIQKLEFKEALLRTNR